MGFTPASCLAHGFRPVDGCYVLSGESLHFAATRSPERVLPMSLQLTLRGAGPNKFEADFRLLIPRILSVKPEFRDPFEGAAAIGR